MPLTASRVKALSDPGVYSDGGGLYLRVKPTGTKQWTYRYQLNGKRRELGLGSADSVSLAQAREAAHRHRSNLAQKIDPKTARKVERAPSVPIFRQCALDYITRKSPQWSNEKHAAQWTSTLERYAFPALGRLPVNEIATSDVMRVLDPIWNEKPETASRVRQRIEAVLASAKVMGYREGENPALWRGHLDQLLRAGKPVKHFAALPFPDLPAFYQLLRAQQSVSALAMRFSILTAARTGEVRGATWDEIDGNRWLIPAARMKARRQHAVPLSEEALMIFKQAEAISVGAVIFPGPRGRPLSSNALLALVQRRMKRPDITPHGFRSTFRDWAAEMTNHPSDVIDMALAHTVGNKVEAAYRRGDLFDKRRELMTDWQSFVCRNL